MSHRKDYQRPQHFSQQTENRKWGEYKKLRATSRRRKQQIRHNDRKQKKKTLTAAPSASTFLTTRPANQTPGVTTNTPAADSLLPAEEAEEASSAPSTNTAVCRRQLIAITIQMNNIAEFTSNRYTIANVQMQIIAPINEVAVFYRHTPPTKTRKTETTKA